MKKSLTWEQHAHLGSAFATFRNEIIIKAAVDIPNAYGKKSREARAVSRALEALDKLRSVLDNRVCEEHPERAKKPQNLYYPAR